MIRNRHPWLIALVILTSFSSYTSYAQQLLMDFTRSTSPYVARTPLNNTTFPIDVDDEFGAPQALPFPFTYYGRVHNNIVVSSNAAIYFTSRTLAGSAPRATLITNAVAQTDSVPALFPYTGDLRSPFTGTGGVSIFTEGTAPNRIAIIQYTGFRSLGNDVPFINFQVKLYETTNVIEYHYGPATNIANFAGSRDVYVGLKSGGPTPQRFEFRAGTWANNNPERVLESIAARIITSNTNFPAEGTLFRYTPVPLNPNFTDLAVVGFINQPTTTNFCDNSTVFPIFTVRNTGDFPITNPSYRFTISGPGLTADTSFQATTATIAPGQLDTIIFPIRTLPSLGTYRITLIIVDSDGDNANNTRVFERIVNTDCSPLRYTFAQSIETFQPISSATAILSTAVTSAFISLGGTNPTPLPFPMIFNGLTYNQLNIFRNGYVRFGTTVGTNLTNVINGVSFTAAAFNATLNYGPNPSSGVFTEVQGTAPNRVFVIEWREMRTLTTSADQSYTFQMRITEGGEISYHYGSFAYLGTQVTQQIGLREETNATFLVRGMNLINNRWDNTFNYDLFANGTTFMNATTVPINGLKFTYTPDLTPFEDVSLSNIINLAPGTPICDSALYHGSIIISNRGNLPISNPELQIRVLRNGVPVDSIFVTLQISLNPSEIDTIDFPSILLPRLGNYTLNFFLASAADINSSNNRLTRTVNITTSCRSLYTFSQSNDVYTPVPNGSGIAGILGGTATTGLAASENLAMPFPFTYAGESFSRIIISRNGYVQFTNSTFTTIASTTNALNVLANNNMVAAYNDNLILGSGPNDSVYFHIEGIAPNRILTIEWRNMAVNLTPAVGSLSFQMKLEESTNKIEFVYGNMSYEGVRRPIQVGLRGANDTIFNIRAMNLAPLATNWETSYQFRGSRAGTMFMGNGFTIPSGLKFTYLAPPPALTDLAVISATYSPTTTTGRCDSTPIQAIAIITNRGSAELTNFSVSTRVTFPNGTVDSASVIVPSLAAGANDTILLPTVRLGGVGTYPVRVSAYIFGDENTLNNLSTVSNFIVSRDCANAPFVFSQQNSTYTPISGGTAVFSGTDFDNQNVVIPMPFPFFFNRTLATTLNVNLNGYAVVNATGTTTEVNPMLTVNNLIAPLGLDLEFASAVGVTSQVIGTAPNRRFIIQWENARRFGQVTSTDYNFQIHFIEGSSEIEFHYGTFTHTATLSTPNVGIRINNDIFTNLTMPLSSTSWADAFIGSNTNNTMFLDAFTTPSSGLVYRFVPTSLPLLDAAALTLLDLPSVVCLNGSVVPKIVVRNDASSTLNNIPARISIRRGTAPAVVSNISLNTTLFTGQADTINLAQILTNDTGTISYTIRLLIPNDENSANDSLVRTIRVRPLSTPNFNAPAVCAGSRVIVKANPVARGSFYADAALSQLLGTGDSLIINRLENTDTVYYGGGTSSTLVRTGLDFGTTASPYVNFTNWGVFFDIAQATNLNAVQVRPNGAGSITVELRRYPATGFTPFTVEATRQFTFTAAQADQNVTLNIDAAMQPGRYALVVTVFTGVSLFRDFGVTTYPLALPNGIGTMQGFTGSLTVTANYYFYNIDLGSINCVAPASIILTANPVPTTPSIVANGDTTFCQGDSVILSGPAGADAYQWSNGATTRQITVRANGTFSLRLRSAQGCLSGISNVIRVRTEAAGVAGPIITTGATTFCQGDSATLTAPISTTYLWSNGATTRSIVVRTTGTYTVSLRTALGCESSPASGVNITVNALPEVPTLSFDASTNTINAIDATPAARYEWRRDGNVIAGLSTRSITVTTGGLYSVRAISAANCSSAISQVLTVVNAANKAMAEAIQISPNPFVNELSIDLGTQATQSNTIQITDLVGKVLATEKVEANVSKLSINLSKLPSATYVVKISNANGSMVQRIVKQ